ncbi:hypothetical protein PCANC_07156 [Puccinia coronata f. sp. avenae]|uniref:Uncharacterized protein n=1 Tax=Puccinia coronata f. sp. avenae TaxID=200324 RepID=A0A2N5SXQ0_9BASI|nr:hypothetical protein PCANC_07156 [Puccinia coronata f. sp. avenae]
MPLLYGPGSPIGIVSYSCTKLPAARRLSQTPATVARTLKPCPSPHAETPLCHSWPFVPLKLQFATSSSTPSAHQPISKKFQDLLFSTSTSHKINTPAHLLSEHSSLRAETHVSSQSSFIHKLKSENGKRKTPASAYLGNWDCRPCGGLLAQQGGNFSHGVGAL